MSKNYSEDNIKTMSPLQHMRQKASMYGFMTSTVNGLFLMIKEIVDNSADESLDPNRTYPIVMTFFVSKDKTTFQCLVVDHGRGIPVGKIVDCLATANTSGKYELGSYGGPSTGTNGVGSKVVAALSKDFVAFTKRPDGFASLKIEKGVVKDHTETRKPIDKNAETVGTTVMFQPDESIMVATPTMFKTPDVGQELLGIDILLDKLNFYTLFHRNSLITVRVVDGLVPQSILKQDPKDLWKYLNDASHFEKSQIIFTSDLNQTPRDFVIRTFGLKQPCWDLGIPLVKENDGSDEGDRLGYTIDIFLDEKSINGEGGLIGAVNSTPINDPNSIHLTMLQTVLKMYLEDYVLDKDKKSFFEVKYQIPISGYVSAVWVGANFDGQDKSKFTDHQFGDFYRSSLRRQLNKVTDATWDRLYELITEHFEQAYAKYTKQQYKLNKNLKGIGFMLKRAGSYIPCRSSDSSVIELIICEGDSAAGRVKSVRDEETQAIYKLSGKPINAERAEAKKLIKNMIYQDLMMLLGVRPTDPDLSGLRFKRIVLLTDADPDGYHIVALLIALIKAINPKILEEGIVYMANPPLYSFRVQGQKHPLYLRDESALLDMKSEIYRRMLDIYVEQPMKTEDGKPVFEKKGVPKLLETKLTSAQYTAFVAVVETVGDRVVYHANQLNIDPYVLEQLLYCSAYLEENKVDPEKICEILKEDARVDEVTWSKESNTITLVTQGLDRIISLSHLKETIDNVLVPLYDKWGWKTIGIYATTRYTDLYVHEPCSFMKLYTIFKNITDTDNSSHFALTRFKGLGEMSEKDILGTCVDPVTRCVTRIMGMGDINVIYNMLGVDTEARKQLTDQSVHGRLVNKGFLEE